MRGAVVAAVITAGCGGGHWTNTLKTPRTTLAEVGAPHLAVVVASEHGLSRVYLDTGHAETLTDNTDAIAIDAATLLLVEAGHYVIERGTTRIPVDAVLAKHRPVVAPDRRHLVTTEDRTIVVIDVADGKVARHAIAASGPGNNSALSIAWAPTSDAVIVDDDGAYQRLDLASGALSPADKLDYRGPSQSDALTCPAKGFKLERRWTHGQQIILVPTASTASPEELSAVESRVLVEATDLPSRGGDGAINLGKKQPEPLGLGVLTPSCEHFVFDLEGKVYVGSIATGRIAYLAPGWGAVL
jgi:hypothetical protein